MKIEEVHLKSLTAAEQGPELPAQAWLHQHVEELGVVECFVQLHDEGAITALHDQLLVENMLLLFGVLNLAFLHLLERECIVVVLTDGDEFHPAEASHAEGGDPLETLEGEAVQLLVKAVLHTVILLLQSAIEICVVFILSMKKYNYIYVINIFEQI